MEVEAGVVKWLGSVGGIVDAPTDRLEKKVFQECAVSDSCSLNKMVTDRIKERLVSMDSTSHNYVYRMEASNVGLDGLINTLNLVGYWDEDALKA
ncbi:LACHRYMATORY-FACTOR SYNTHASE [Salix purpurea]|uniref:LACHRYMATORY-FACTOR SYNTHASE n=1 Tax=Salix purpurea TaxID=77065 RepID=A0A9Q0Z9Z1_SALPP|nr:LACHRYMATORY-FACTOR SYNTHASE [Salix purpurea]